MGKNGIDIGKRSKNIFAYILMGVIVSAVYMMRKSVFSFIRWIKLSPMLPYILLGIIIVVLIILIVIYFILKSARKEVPPMGVAEEPAPAASEEEKKEPVAKKTALSGFKLRRSFARAEKLLKANVAGRNYRYQVPWFLMVGETASGKTDALRLSGLNLPLGDPMGKGPEIKEACNWWFFERGIVLDIAGDLVLQEDGKTSDDKLWRLLLRLLQQHRPERPIDGVVITIPCTDLIPPESQKAPDLNKAAERADLLYKKIWHAQKVLGIRFPIYILITKCDQIDGFKSFCQELPVRLSNNIFGWSSPYGIDTSYSSDWTKEAFQNINRELSQTQFEIFTEGTKLQENDDLFMFPANFQPISEALQVYLDHLFKQSAYHESFVFRGLYFCGDSGIEKKETDSIKPFFVKDLFEKKVFPEHILARPLKRTLISRNKTVFVTQIIAALIIIVSSLGLWSTYNRLQKDKIALVPVLDKITNDIYKLREGKDTQYESLMLYNLLHKQSGRIDFAQSAKHLFKGMTNVKSLTYVFIPSSWFSDIHHKIRKTMTLAYDEIILKAIYIDLIQKAKTIFETQNGITAGNTKSKEIIPVGETPEFVELKTFVENLKELEKYVNLYNGLSTSKDLTDIGRIVKYLYRIDLPPDFYKNAKYYHDALRDTEYRFFDPLIFKLKAKFFTLKQLTGKLYDRLFSSNVILGYLQFLSIQIENFGEEGRNYTRDGKLIRDLIDNINRTEKVLMDTSLSWTFKDSFNLDKSFNNLLAMIEESKFLGPKLRRETEQTGEDAFQELKEELKQKRSALTGALLKWEAGRLQTKFSSGVLTFKADLEKLLSQEFMVFEPVKGQEIGMIPGTRLRWDTALLSKAVKVFEPYEIFKKDKLKNFPLELQNIITGIAKESLEKKVQDLIAQAQHFEPLPDGFSGKLSEANVLSEIRNFKEAAKLLSRLLTHFDQLDLVYSHLILSDLLYWQTATLLEAFDGFLKEEILYSIKGGNFSWWDGSEPLSLTAFDVIDEKELENYLKIQRNRIKHLAFEYAKPLVTFFSTNYILRQEKEERILFKWDRLISELEKYETKKPENSVSVLENFILFDLNKINENNYLEKIARKDLSTRSGDIFLQRRNELRRILFDQCQRLSSKKISAEYRLIKDFFNKKLAGKFPFSKVLEKNDLAEADPENIRDFYLLFDKNVKMIKDVLKTNKEFGIPGSHTLEFINQMEDVRRIFSSYLDGEGKQKQEIPTLDFDVELRINRNHELLANRVIDWKIKVGDQLYLLGDDKRIGRWQLGDPIMLSFRWAKNAVEYPVFGGDQDGITIQDKSITYVFNNQWSIFRFLKLHAGSPGDFDKLADPKPHTLKFLVDTRQDEMIDTRIKDTSLTKIFIRVILLTPDKIKGVLIMPFFPEKAPDLEPVMVSG